MSCSVHDVIRLEALGVATAVVVTEPFVDEALEQAQLLGMPEYRGVLIPHPVQLLPRAELRERADRAFCEIRARLTTTGTCDTGAGSSPVIRFGSYSG